MRFFALILVCCLAFVPSSAQAENVHALAMHGQPKYAADFKHLDYVNPDAPKGGVLRMAKTGSFNNLNHHIVMGTNAEGLEYLNDKLMQRVWDEPFTLYGLVAEKADIAPDRSWVVFHLNKAAKFHDGKPMTAEDVKFSYESYRKHGHPVRRRVYGLVSDVKIIDPQTIKFTFGPGFDRESVMILGLMPVLPKHYWEKRDISKTTLEAPLGSGPYKIKSVEPGRKVIFERVKDWWAKDLPVNRGQYNFDTLIYNYFRDDGVALQSLLAGEYDLRREYDIRKWKMDYDSKSVSSGKLKKEEIAHQRPEWLKAFVFNTRRPLFHDIRVRQALALMFDYEWLNKNFYYDALKPIDSVFPNSELAAHGKPEDAELVLLDKYKKDLTPAVFNNSYHPPSGDLRGRQRQAMDLLKKAGWAYQKQNLVNGSGEKFAFEILLDSPSDEKVALSFARALKKIGVEMKVRTIDSAQFTGRLESFDFDMVSYRWINSLSPGNEQMNYWGSLAAKTNGSRNYAGVDSHVVDAVADSIARAESREDLVARSRALDRILMQGSYMIPLFYLGRDLVAYNPEIRQPQNVPIYGVVLESWWRAKSQ